MPSSAGTRMWYNAKVLVAHHFPCDAMYSHLGAGMSRGPKSLLRRGLVEDVQRPRIAASRLLRQLASESRDAESLATPLDLLAERLGVDVAAFNPDTRRDGILGWLEPGDNLIYLRDGLPEASRRFTLAHELGHFVLHRPSSEASAGLTDPQDPFDDTPGDCDDRDLDSPIDALAATEETLRPGQAYSARARRESEANIFASSLLLPAETLLPAYERALRRSGPAHPRRATLRTLAERFGVSEDALLRRLTALLLPSAESSAEDAMPIAPPGDARLTVHLDAWQRAAAEAETPALVVAGPGTGKTSTLVARVAYLVRQRDVPPRSILALTFSNKAAREMRARLAALLGASGAAETASDASAQLALPAVSTIHSFCGDLLRRYAPLVGLRPDFRLVSETDGYFLLRELAGNLDLGHYQPLASPGMHFPALLAAISRAKDELCEPERYAEVARAMLDAATSDDERLAAERAVEVAEVYRAYQDTLAARGDADFGDMIRLAVRLLRDHPETLAEVRAHYQHVLVDEFQDINRAMGVLLRTLAGERGPLWAVGDADQAIYRFRGASPANLSQFTAEYADAHVYSLRENYRSVPDVLDAAAALSGKFLGGGASREALESVRPATAHAALTLAEAASEDAELHGLATAMRVRMAEGRLLSDQVVLCRTRRQCQRVAEALAAEGIQAHIVAPLLEHDDVKDVLAVMALLADASGSGLLRAGHVPDHRFSRDAARYVLAAAREQREPPIAALARILANEPELAADDRAGLAALRDVLADLRQVPDVATGLARYIFALTTYGVRLLTSARDSDDEARERAAALAQLLAMARTFVDRRGELRRSASASSSRFTAGAPWAAFLDYVRVVSVLRQEVGGTADEMSGGAGRDAVRVLTVHASKGLEFPVVYLPYLVDRRFPMQRQGNAAPLPGGIAEDTSDSTAAHLAEEACLFYVALTRARDELVLSHAERYGRMRYKPSPFLAPIAARLESRLRHVRWTTPATRATDERDREDELSARETIELRREPSTAVLRPSAIETYSRCPRQYAYRYVYGLHPQEVGLATLRRTLHDTLNALHAGFATSEPGGAHAHPSLDDAWEIFEARWAEAIRRDRADPDAPTADDATSTPDEHANGDSSVVDDDPFLHVYRQHGRRAVERAWRGLAQASNGSASGPYSEVAEPDVAEFDRALMVRVNGRDINVTLDRIDSRNVEPPQRANGARRHTAPPPDAQEIARGSKEFQQPARTSEPVRIVRHRLGKGNGASQADLRTLFYKLAADSGAAGPRAELVQHNLTTGEVEPMKLDERKLAKLRDNLDAVLEGMERGHYPAKPDPAMCSTCPFLLICPA